MSPPRPRAIAAFGILTGALVCGGWLLGRGFSVPSDGLQRERLFDDVVSRIQRYYVDSVPLPVLFEKALAGLITEIGDPNTLYLPPDRLKRLTESTSGLYTGAGVRFDVRDGVPTVIAPLPGGPAERAGVLSGDRIFEIDGKSTRGWTDEETRNAMRGPAGTHLTFRIDRPGRTGPLSVVLTRDEVHRQAVRRTALVAAGVGYVDLRGFNDSTEGELTRAIDSLASAGMRSLVLDLRGNPGGLLTQGVAVADLFLDPNQTIVRMRGRSAEVTRAYEDRLAQRWPALPIVALVDEGSASAAEIVAGALQDHDRALVVGRTSYGKGSAQGVFQTSVGGLKLTTARWYTPSGRSIDRHDPRAVDADSGQTYKTDAGRVVYGGGGIAPDVVAGDTALAPAELVLQHVLGERVTDFRDALTAYAASLRGKGRVPSPEFEVTAAMLDGAWRLMRDRGFAFDKRVYDGASGLVSKLLGREIVRLEFGAAAESRRAINEDDVIQRALALLAGVHRPSDVFTVKPVAAARPRRPVRRTT